MSSESTSPAATTAGRRGGNRRIGSEAISPALMNKARLELSDDARASIRRYGLPGNVRELRNVIERRCDSGAIGVNRP